MLFMGTNDQYWTVDAIKHYIDSIPGENYVHYVPNVGHDLGDKRQALEALSAFFGNTISKKPYADCEWNISYSKKGIVLKVTTSPESLVGASLWSADSDDTDFRDNKWSGQEIPLKKKKPEVVISKPAYPATGYRAFYLDLKYKDPNGGEYTESTRMFLADNDEVFVK